MPFKVTTKQNMYVLRSEKKIYLISMPERSLSPLKAGKLKRHASYLRMLFPEKKLFLTAATIMR